MSTTIRCLGILFVLALLTVSFCPNASGQSWTSTATKAYPVQNLSNATLLGPLDPSTPLHIVVGLQEQNGNQVQPTLRRVLTPGDALYGTSFTVQQFVRQFGPTSAQVQGVQNYLSSKGFANIAVSDNQLLIEADGTAAGVTAAFNTPLAKYSVGGANVYVNTGDAQVPASLAGMVAAVLGLNNVVAVHIDAHTLALNTSPATDPCTPPNCPTPAVANEVFGPQQYQIAYDAACPSDNPHCPAQNVAVGGTNLFTNADFTYDFETGWEASGGGPSYFENPPFWQTYTGSGTLPVVPSSEGSAVGVGRGVPDVSMCARGTGLAICSANVFVSGTATLIGGTSLSSPLAMGSWARIQTAHKNKLGFAGPLIYQLANGGPSPSSPDFNDVVLGGNGLFTALPGYDYVTGLGSWDIYRINALIPSTYPQ
jgi:subtilase family serine protease